MPGDKLGVSRSEKRQQDRLEQRGQLGFLEQSSGTPRQPHVAGKFKLVTTNYTLLSSADLATWGWQP